jgi:hypothetical protein
MSLGGGRGLRGLIQPTIWAASYGVAMADIWRERLGRVPTSSSWALAKTEF